MKINPAGAKHLWRILRKCDKCNSSTALQNLANLMLENNGQGVECLEEGEEAFTYWSGVLDFLKEWTDAVGIAVDDIKTRNRKAKRINKTGGEPSVMPNQGKLGEQSDKG